MNIDIWDKNMITMVTEPPTASENIILFCDECGSVDFEENTIAYEDVYESEKEIICKKCGKIVNYWSYGFYDNLKSDKYLHKEKQLLRKNKLKQLNCNNDI